MDCVMQFVHISFEEKTKRKWPWTCVYPQKDKLRNPKIDYTAIGFHNGRMDTETFQHIDISKVKSIHELAIYTGLKSVSKLSSFSAVPDYFFSSNIPFTVSKKSKSDNGISAKNMASPLNRPVCRIHRWDSYKVHVQKITCAKH